MLENSEESLHNKDKLWFILRAKAPKNKAGQHSFQAWGLEKHEETKNLSTDASSRTNTIFERLSDLSPFFYFFF